MKPILALAATAAIALSAPAFAQTGGAPGAIGSTGGLSGSNTPGSGQDSQRVYSDPYANNSWNNGWNNDGQPGSTYSGGSYFYNGYNGPGYYSAAGVFERPAMNEGRAAAPDMSPPPRHVRGAQNPDDDQE